MDRTPSITRGFHPEVDRLSGAEAETILSFPLHTSHVCEYGSAPMRAGGESGDGSMGEHLLRDHRPPEDAGAETQARFHYQHECTARSCIPLLLENHVIAVVCEEHEDFVVFYEGDEPELVSVKHREPSQGPWTISALCTGGVGHLFDRWLGVGGRARCRLMTNAGLSPAPREAGAFAEACHSRSDEEISPWLPDLQRRLAAAEGDEVSVRTFAKSLSIESGLPSKSHLAAVNLRDLMIPALEALGLASTVAQHHYERLLVEIASANRDATGDPIDLVEYAADPHRLDRALAVDRRLGRRTITRERARRALAAPALGEVQLGGADLDGDVPTPSRLRQKLSRGGLGPTGIDTAMRLRASWYAFEAAHRMNIPGGDPVFDDLRLRVQELVAACEARIDRSANYAPEMYLDVRESVTTSALKKQTPFPLDDKLLQGLVFQLTDECTVWWSERFEPDA